MESTIIGIDLAREGSDQTVYTITHQMIVDAFNKWRDEYKANHEGWTDAIDSGDDYGVKCADKLIECMKQVEYPYVYGKERVDRLIE